MNHYDIVIAIRCHQWPYLILDTISSIECYCQQKVLIVCAVDYNIRVAELVGTRRPDIPIFLSKRKHGWGAGLYTLLCDTIKWLDRQTTFTYDHFLTVDYDTLFIGSGVDTRLLKRHDEDASVGLWGPYTAENTRWTVGIEKCRKKIERLMPYFPPKGYRMGETTLGCFMFLTRPCLSALKRGGFLDDPFRDITNTGIDIVDDPWLAIMVRATGYGIGDTRDFAYCYWRLQGDYKHLPADGYLALHPTKIEPASNDLDRELELRNYFRSLRRQPPLGEEAKLFV